MPEPTPSELREMILQIAEAQRPRGPMDAPLYAGTLFGELQRRLGAAAGLELQRAALTAFHDLMRTGYFAWGNNFSNPDPPKFHITARGDAVLERLSHDPANPEGYLRQLYDVARLSDVARSYLEEGLACFVAGHFKAAAVMLGAASESMVLDIRDTTLDRLRVIGQSAPAALSDWRVKTVLDGLAVLLNAKRAAMPRDVREEFDAYFQSIAQTIRAARNDAGHPTSVAPVTEESVHASFLLFSTLAGHYSRLGDWIRANLP
jgi:hypothetical protein